MSATLFDGFQPIDRYDRENLAKELTKLAQRTGGKLNQVALNWNFSGSNIVVKEIYWKGFIANLWIEHDWTVHTNLSLNLPLGTTWQLRFNNIYGEVSGVPIIGQSRVESDIVSQAVAAILPETAYWQLALTKEPFALTLAKERLNLATYRFYQHEFYLEALDYIAELAERLEVLSKRQVPVKATISPIELPWCE